MYAHDVADFMDNNNFATELESFVNTSLLPLAQVNAKKVSGLDHLVLAKKWGISPKKALNTIHCSTQHGVHTVLHLSSCRQFRTNKCQLCYRRLLHNVYSDTLLAATVSSRGNGCSQIFATNFSWPRLFPMKLKSKAHEALSLLFQQDGVPPAIICDKPTNYPRWV